MFYQAKFTMSLVLRTSIITILRDSSYSSGKKLILVAVMPKEMRMTHCQCQFDSMFKEYPQTHRRENGAREKKNQQRNAMHVVPVRFSLISADCNQINICNNLFPAPFFVLRMCVCICVRWSVKLSFNGGNNNNNNSLNRTKKKAHR